MLKKVVKTSAASAALLLAVNSALAGPAVFNPGDLVVSTSLYTGTPGTITVGQPLPGGGNAVADGTYPTVFNNDVPDSSFGITSPLYLNDFAVNGTTGHLVSTLPLPTSEIVTSFSSKSEGALNLSSDGHSLTFIDYVAAPNTLDVSNSNTPGVIDPTNPVKGAFSRGVATIDAAGKLTVIPTDAYSGNNGRAAILANGVYYLAGNAGNGSGSPANIAAVAGMQLLNPGAAPATSRIGNFNITQYGYAADKTAKDNNFRGETIFNNTLYATKGSGGNGINTVYQVGNAGALPTAADAATAPITILPGFPTNLAKNDGATGYFPFGIFFANASTLYVADEGDGVAADAATAPNAGLEKWSLVGGVWKQDYTIQTGLNLGLKYTVAGYPSSLDPATDGLRNLTGQVNADGTVSLYAITSTISASGDQGADPNELVAVTDLLSATSLPSSESFSVLGAPTSGEVYRGVSFAPTAVPLPTAAWPAFGIVGGLGMLHLARRRKLARA